MKPVSRKITNTDVIEIAGELGFDLVGFSQADNLSDEINRLNSWLDKGYHANMSYMERNREKRFSPEEIMPGAQSIISMGINYYSDEKYSGNNQNGKISRYAWGTDYHEVIWKKLDEFKTGLKKIDPEFECRTFVDTGPVMDKAWAVKAGIGWMGKHSNIINRKFGSWFFIATVITNCRFEYSEQIPDFCGSCTSCIDACPTDAIVADYVVDSNKCISYQTIENKGEIDVGLKGKFENWIFGCDICQDVCPWNNKFSQISALAEFYPREGNKEINLNEAAEMSQEEFSRRFKKSPVKRTKLKGLKRNARFIKG